MMVQALIMMLSRLTLIIADSILVCGLISAATIESRQEMRKSESNGSDVTAS